MGLSATQMEYLAALYDSWGVDEVRVQLEQDDRGVFVDPEVTEFAHAWLEAHEHETRHGRFRLVRWTLVGAILAGAVMGWAFGG